MTHPSFQAPPAPKQFAEMQSPHLSLTDIAGKAYTDAVCRARAFLTGEDQAGLQMIADERVDFAPDAYRRRLDELVDVIGQQVCDGASETAQGAGTSAFNHATHTAAAPLSGFGFIRIGQDGRAYLISKSEHYHAPLGHSFPGYQLLDHARQLGIPNATHNNTRGHLTRLSEETLIRLANGVAPGDGDRLNGILADSRPHMLSRVINLETGSLAVEAALKMMLARFYRLDSTFETPPYQGRTPVFLVMGDYAGGQTRSGGRKANYHGTTVLTQVMRDLWPEFGDRLEGAGLYTVKPVRINDIADFEAAVAAYDSGATKVAGFLHEIVLMNYGGIRLHQSYLQRAYDLCHAHDIPILVDEIQSCMWSPALFMFREYGLQPDFVSVGKGFPGGEYPASRILATAALDNLNQFGALVTNGQEELASLAYLVTIAFAEMNAAYTREIGEAYEREMHALAQKYPEILTGAEGRRHLGALFFHEVETTVKFCKQLADAGIDVSAHTYKAECPPAALTKIPLISTYKMVEVLIGTMDAALRRL